MASSVLNSDDGVISGTAGLKSVGGDDGNLVFQSKGTETARITATGNVGIGTNSPNSKLSIDHSSTSTSVLGAFANIPVLLQNTSNTDNNWTVIAVQDASGDFSSYIGTQNTSQSSNTSVMTFATNNGSGATEQARITSAGLFQFNSGYGSVATAYGCRAWVNFNGTGTVAIREDGNVSSITDNGTGDYTVNFATAMPDANFCAVGSQSDDSMQNAGVEVNPATTTTIIIRTKNFSNNTNADALKVSVAVFR
jgi:hypothetical protein